MDTTTVTLTAAEKKTAVFYLEKALINAEGMAAIGMASKGPAENLKSIINKLNCG